MLKAGNFHIFLLLQCEAGKGASQIESAAGKIKKKKLNREIASAYQTESVPFTIHQTERASEKIK